MDVGQLRILVPVLGRPQRVEPLIDSAIARTPGLTLEQIIFIPDPGDASEIRTLEAVGGESMPCSGSYAKKINTAARWYTAADPSIRALFLGADDLDFKPGWFTAARARIVEDVKVVGVNDLIRRRGAKANHATHFLVDADYIEQGTIDRPGHLLHEGYDHSFTDNEFIATAKHRGVYAYAAESHVEHLHPLVGKAETDPTYQRGMRDFAADQQIFKAREAMWS